MAQCCQTSRLKSLRFSWLSQENKDGYYSSSQYFLPLVYLAKIERNKKVPPHQVYSVAITRTKPTLFPLAKKNEINVTRLIGYGSLLAPRGRHNFHEPIAAYLIPQQKQGSIRKKKKRQWLLGGWIAALATKPLKPPGAGTSMAARALPASLCIHHFIT